ncbi:hypothetical protein Tco_0250732 [Tanacetum coccineum]
MAYKSVFHDLEIRKLCDIVLTSPTVIGAISGTNFAGSTQLRRTSPPRYLEPRVDKYNLLRGGCSDSGISSLRSTGGGMYKEGGSGGSGGDGDGSSGDECVGGAVHLARCSPREGGDIEIGGDGDVYSTWPEVYSTRLGGREYGICGRRYIPSPNSNVSEGWWYNRLCSLRWENRLINMYNNSRLRLRDGDVTLKSY